MAGRVGCSAGLLLGVLLALTPPAAVAGDGWWGALDEGEAVSLTDVLANPQSYRGRTLTFFCLFHSRENYFDPVRTPFTPNRYDNVSVWPDGAPIWEEHAFRRDLPFLYIPRDHPERDALLRLEVVTRIEVTGKIRCVLRGRPFIEVFGFRPTGHRVGRQIVRAVNAGDNYARLGTTEGDQLAASRYREALQPDLPPVYDLIVRKRLADALRRLGNGEQADLVQRGEILGAGGMPAPQPAMPFEEPEPALGATPFDELPPGVTSPGVTLPGRIPPGTIPPDTGEPWDPPTAPPGSSFPAPSLPQPFTDDLPGQPVGPVTPADDLPGMPAGAAPRAPVLPPPPLPGRRPGASPGVAGQTTPRQPPAQPEGATPRREPVLDGVPPRRRPRLSGVK